MNDEQRGVKIGEQAEEIRALKATIKELRLAEQERQRRDKRWRELADEAGKLLVGALNRLSRLRDDMDDAE